MPEQFPYIGYHFDVLFLTPGLNINANFKTVSGLGFDSGTATEAEGGLSGFSHQLTDRGNYKNLTLTRGFTDDKRLFDWCESTHNTLKVKPCNILVSLLNKQQLPVKSWLLFHAIPKNWTGGDLGVDNSTVMMESITFSYQNFMLL